MKMPTYVRRAFEEGAFLQSMVVKERGERSVLFTRLDYEAIKKAEEPLTRTLRTQGRSCGLRAGDEVKAYFDVDGPGDVVVFDVAEVEGQLWLIEAGCPLP